MKMTWFQHPACTTEESDELVRQYRRRGVKTERSPDESPNDFYQNH
ncbi:hypothetical protein [Salmonella enterica]|nr:hypothetical protein [Salmonella enterica]